VDEVSIIQDGIEYTATYSVEKHALKLTLPDGSSRQTELRGLKPNHAAKTHLKFFILSQAKAQKSRFRRV